ncbi:MAG: ATP-binding protein [Egibacteraceae bacterium]
MAGGIAHDLNNVLAPIMLAVEVLEVSDDDAAASRMLEVIKQCADRGAEMVRRVLSFAGGVGGHQRELDLNGLLDDVALMVRTMFPKNICIQRETGIEVWPVNGDPTQLHQVVMNLCINARDAMPDGGTLRLSIDNITVGDHYATRDQQAEPGRYVRIRVEDDGTGIAQATMDRIFEPFFTTKTHGEGTGLGLSTSRGIVRSHGGFFQITSQPDTGSTFDVYVPVADPPDVIARLDGDGASLPHGNGEVVLLIDDEGNVRSATRRTLETAGYRVIEASGGMEAVPLFKQRADDVAAVIVDMMMPQMDGPATIQALFEHRADLPVIAVTGLIVSREVARATNLGVEHFLAKPFTAGALLTTLHTLLQR